MEDDVRTEEEHDQAEEPGDDDEGPTDAELDEMAEMARWYEAYEAGLKVF